jgi:hypothetical protein
VCRVVRTSSLSRPKGYQHSASADRSGYYTRVQVASKVIAILLNLSGLIVAVIFVQSIVVFGSTSYSYWLRSTKIYS